MTTSVTKKRTNVTLDSVPLDEAPAFGLNVSAISEAALPETLRSEKATVWKRENAEAIKQRGVWIEKNGLPLANWQTLKVESET